MEQKIIFDSVINELSTFLKELFSGSEKYKSQKVLHIEASNKDDMGWIGTKKEELRIQPNDYNVLIEYNDCPGGMKFVMHGNSSACDMLAKKYGGCVSNCNYWIMYNEPKTNWNHGYKEKLPTAQEVIGFVETVVNRRK